MPSAARWSGSWEAGTVTAPVCGRSPEGSTSRRAAVALQSLRTPVGAGHSRASFDATRSPSPMLYALLCYNPEEVVYSWSKEEDDAVMARLDVVHQRLL